MRTIKNLVSMWKEDVNWNAQSSHGKRVMVWFGISVCLILVAGLSWLTVPALVNFIIAAKAVSKLEVSE